jgi:hypothetical protein
MHNGGIVDIPFPRSVRDALLEEALAEEHHWVPDSGWTTFHVHGKDGFKHVRWLMRLSYLPYALKTAPDPRDLLEQETRELRLTPQFRALLEQFVPSTTPRASVQSLTA